MKVSTGDRKRGPAGVATEVLCELEAGDPPELGAGVARWFLHCPGQSAGWDHYLLTTIHLRPIDGVPAHLIQAATVTHELIVVALDPARDPVAEDPSTWSFLSPWNTVEQLELPDDDAARLLTGRCAEAVVCGMLPAEPMLSGEVEPWHSVLQESAVRLRAGAHKPSITCPVCGSTSHHPKDVTDGYCGACHAYTTGPGGGPRSP